MSIGTNGTLPDFGAPTLQGFDMTRLQEGQRLPGLSNRQYVRFYKKNVMKIKAVEVAFNPRTKQEEPKRFEPVEEQEVWVHIKTPGDTNEIDTVASDFHKHEFFRQYQAFCEGKTAPIGTPVEQAPFIGGNMVAELHIHRIYTVEQLADASEYVCNSLAHGMILREYARAFVKANQANANSAVVQSLKAQLDEQKKLITGLQAQIEAAKVGVNSEAVSDMTEQFVPGVVSAPVAELMAKPRGRPKKVTATATGE